MPKSLVSNLQIKMRPQLFAAACKGANPKTNTPHEPFPCENLSAQRGREKNTDVSVFVKGYLIENKLVADMCLCNEMYMFRVQTEYIQHTCMYVCM